MAKKRNRKRLGPDGRPLKVPPLVRAPTVDVEVAAGMDLRAATALVKPALLYADSVTLYSPAASLVLAFADLAAVSDPYERALVALEIIRGVPELRSQMPMQDQALTNFEQLLRRRIDSRVLESLGATTDAAAAVDQLVEQVSEMWGDLEPQVEEVQKSVGGTELLHAVKAGHIKVADLSAPDHRFSAMQSAVRAAATEGSHHGGTDEMLEAYLARTIGILQAGRTFPMLDPQTTDLVRFLLEHPSGADSDTLRRGAEVSAAATFMSFLPNFDLLPINEVVDLRAELRRPLVKFRGAIASLAKTFRSTPIDAKFSVEMEQAWREQVAPQLAEIEDLLREHGLLREAVRAAADDVRRILAGSGFGGGGAGLLAFAAGSTSSIGHALMAASAVGVPAADVFARAARSRGAGQSVARQNSFYFLRCLDVRSESMSTR